MWTSIFPCTLNLTEKHEARKSKHLGKFSLALSWYKTRKCFPALRRYKNKTCRWCRIETLTTSVASSPSWRDLRGVCQWWCMWEWGRRDGCSGALSTSGHQCWCGSWGGGRGDGLSTPGHQCWCRSWDGGRSGQWQHWWLTLPPVSLLFCLRVASNQSRNARPDTSVIRAASTRMHQFSKFGRPMGFGGRVSLFGSSHWSLCDLSAYPHRLFGTESACWRCPQAILLVHAIPAQQRLLFLFWRWLFGLCADGC
jgi:hypothetical protein